jgi:precorrin-2/cobalt-factor-2 C20-methyltransferase
VVRAHVADDTVAERLTFAIAEPVDGAQQRRHRHWDAAAERIVEHLRSDAGSAAFATIVDPSVYSTFGYLAATVRSLLPDAEIRTIPGITAMRATASAAGITLVESFEPLTVLPLTRNVTAVADRIEAGGTVVVCKGGRRLFALREVITRSRALDRAIYAEHLGTRNVRVLPLSEVDIAEPDSATGGTVPSQTASSEGGPYLSTVVVLPLRGGRGEQL